MRKSIRVFLCSAVAILTTAVVPAQTFRQSQFPSAGQRLFGIKAADVNNDGNLDLIAISDPNDRLALCAGNPNGESSQDLAVHLGNGDGTFGPPTVLHSNSCWVSSSLVEVEVVDVNKDGKPDLVYAGGDTLGIMLGNGDGNFQTPNLFHAVTLGSTNGDLVNSLGVADFNNDGNSDFVVSTTQYLQIFYGNGDGTVSDPALLDTVDPTVGTFGGTVPGNFDVEAGDFNHDGNADLAFVWCCDPFEQTNRLYTFFGDGHGGFPASWYLVSYLGTSSFGGSLSVVDIDRDGFPDIVGSIFGGVSTYLYVGNETFAPIYASGSSSASNTLGWSDFNGDGILDLVTGTNCGSTPGCTRGILIWPRTAGRSILGPIKVNIDTAPNGVGDVIAADFNNDGNADIAAVIDLNQIAVLLNQTAPRDNVSPETAISSAFDSNGVMLPDGGVTLANGATLMFAGSDNVGVTGFECRMDGIAFIGCTSPASYSGLAVGAHSFEVRAIDAAGNRDATPAHWSFAVEAAPDTAISSVVDGTGAHLANGAVTLSNSVTFVFSGSDNIGVSRFECHLDASTFATCASPATYSGLSLGRHEFAARAVDTSGFADPTPATFVLTVDAAPDTAITSATDNTGRTIANGGSMHGSSITFRFSGTDNNAVVGFECSRDGAAFGQCTSPITYSVTPGSHNFRARAIDSVGFRDPTPALFTWTK